MGIPIDCTWVLDWGFIGRDMALVGRIIDIVIKAIQLRISWNIWSVNIGVAITGLYAISQIVAIT